MDVRGTGCNDLIRDGVTLVQSADDILQDMPASFGDRPGQTAGMGLSEFMTSVGDEPDESEILTAHDQVERGLSSTPVAVDRLIRELRLPAPLVNAVLLEMELAGTLTRHPGGFISR